MHFPLSIRLWGKGKCTETRDCHQFTCTTSDAFARNPTTMAGKSVMSSLSSFPQFLNQATHLSEWISSKLLYKDHFIFSSNYLITSKYYSITNWCLTLIQNLFKISSKYSLFCLFYERFWQINSFLYRLLTQIIHLVC